MTAARNDHPSLRSNIKTLPCCNHERACASYDAENQQEDVNGSDCMIASLHCQRLQGVGQVQHGIQPNQPRRIRMTARNSQEVTRAPYQSADLLSSGRLFMTVTRCCKGVIGVKYRLT